MSHSRHVPSHHHTTTTTTAHKTYLDHGQGTAASGHGGGGRGHERLGGGQEGEGEDGNDAHCSCWNVGTWTGGGVGGLGGKGGGENGRVRQEAGRDLTRPTNRQTPLLGRTSFPSRLIGGRATCVAFASRGWTPKTRQGEQLTSHERRLFFLPPDDATRATSVTSSSLASSSACPPCLLPSTRRSSSVLKRWSASYY